MNRYIVNVHRTTTICQTSDYRIPIFFFGYIGLSSGINKILAMLLSLMSGQRKCKNSKILSPNFVVVKVLLVVVLVIEILLIVVDIVSRNVFVDKINSDQCFLEKIKRSL